MTKNTKTGPGGEALLPDGRVGFRSGPDVPAAAAPAGAGVAGPRLQPHRPGRFVFVRELFISRAKAVEKNRAKAAAKLQKGGVLWCFAAEGVVFIFICVFLISLFVFAREEAKGEGGGGAKRHSKRLCFSIFLLFPLWFLFLFPSIRCRRPQRRQDAGAQHGAALRRARGQPH
jgi:hypothetical protein